MTASASPQPWPRRRWRRSGRQWGQGRLAFCFAGPAFLFVTAVVIYPLLYALWASFRNLRLTSPRDSFVWFDAYADALSSSTYLESLWVTAIFLVVAIGLEFLIGFALALSFARMKGTHPIMRALLLLPVMATPVTVGLVWKLMLNSEFGLVTALGDGLGLGRILWLSDPTLALLSVILMDVWQWTPFVFLVLLAGLESLPRDPFDAAEVDGASAWQTLRYVTLPLMRRVIAVALAFRLMFAIATFDSVFVLTKGGPARATDIVSLLIHREGLVNLNISFAAATSFVLLILVLVTVTLLFRRSLSDAR